MCRVGGMEEGGGLGGVVLLLPISQEQSKEEEVNYARGSNGSVKFLSHVSLVDFNFTASEVGLFWWGV